MGVFSDERHHSTFPLPPHITVRLFTPSPLVFPQTAVGSPRLTVLLLIPLLTCTRLPSLTLALCYPGGLFPPVRPAVTGFQASCYSREPLCDCQQVLKIQDGCCLRCPFNQRCKKCAINLFCVPFAQPFLLRARQQEESGLGVFWVLLLLLVPLLLDSCCAKPHALYAIQTCYLTSFHGPS